MNEISLTPEQVAFLKRWAWRCSPEEACAVLVGRVEAGKKRVRKIHPSENQSQESKDRHYSVDPRVLAETLFRARDRGDDLIGFFHSHPSSPALPSHADRDAAWQGYSYLILGSEGRLRSFCPRGDRSWSEERVVAEIESGA